MFSGNLDSDVFVDSRVSRVCLLAVSKKQQVTDVCARPLFAAQDQKKVKFSPEREDTTKNKH